jgi:predicted RNase H-like HicB family nuclease
MRQSVDKPVYHEGRDRMELTANIRHEEGMYWAEVEQLPGCFASGESVSELIASLEEAVSLYLASDLDEPVETRLASVSLHADREPQTV